MLNRTLLTSALLLSTATASLANSPSPFIVGWNLVTATNCLFIPGNSAATPPVSDAFDIYVELVQPSPPVVPPPIPIEGMFTTTDPIAISIAVPFCKDGTKFYFWWDGTKATYFSMYQILNAS